MADAVDAKAAPGRSHTVAKFEIGDKVRMPGVPFVVEVQEIGACDDGPGCPLGAETFRFSDPGGLGDDWMHTSEFEKA
jgi:hypothetical protein